MASKVLGAPLTEVLRRQAERGLPAELPLLVTQCIAFLRDYLDVEGIFRLSGSADLVKRLGAEFDAKGTVDLRAVKDCHAVAALLKKFLRELPEPPLTFDLYREFVEVKSMASGRAQIVALRTVLEKLPTSNYTLVRELCSLVTTVVGHAAQNRMTLENMVTCIGPNMLRSQGSTQTDMMYDLDHVNAIVTLIFKHSDALFAREPPPVLSSPSHHGGAASVFSSPDQSVATQPSPTPTPETERAVNAEIAAAVARNLFGQPAPPGGPPPDDDDDDGAPSADSDMAEEEMMANTRAWTVADIPAVSMELERLELEVHVFTSVFLAKFSRAPRLAELAPIQDTTRAVEAYRRVLERLNNEKRAATAAAGPSAAVAAALQQQAARQQAAVRKAPAPAPSTPSAIDRYLADPLPDALQRITLLIKEMGAPAEPERMTLAQLDKLKSAFKQELRGFDSAFETRHGVAPKKADKEIMRPLYLKYRNIRTLVEARGGTSSPPPESSAPPPVAAAPAPMARVPSAAAVAVPAVVAPPAAAAAAAAAAAPAPSRAAAAAAAPAPAVAIPTGAAPRPAGAATPTAASATPTSSSDPAVQLVALRARKRVLQLALHEYQEAFERKFQRKVQFVDDRLPVQAEYAEYKDIKARIAALDGSAAAE